MRHTAITLCALLIVPAVARLTLRGAASTAIHLGEQAQAVVCGGSKPCPPPPSTGETLAVGRSVVANTTLDVTYVEAFAPLGSAGGSVGDTATIGADNGSYIASPPYYYWPLPKVAANATADIVSPRSKGSVAANLPSMAGTYKGTVVSPDIVKTVWNDSQPQVTRTTYTKDESVSAEPRNTSDNGDAAWIQYLQTHANLVPLEDTKASWRPEDWAPGWVGEGVLTSTRWVVTDAGTVFRNDLQQVNSQNDYVNAVARSPLYDYATGGQLYLGGNSSYAAR